MVPSFLLFSPLLSLPHPPLTPYFFSHSLPSSLLFSSLLFSSLLFSSLLFSSLLFSSLLFSSLLSSPLLSSPLLFSSLLHFLPFSFPPSFLPPSFSSSFTPFFHHSPSPSSLPSSSPDCGVRYLLSHAQRCLPECSWGEADWLQLH